jgi:hypothetical protein
MFKIITLALITLGNSIKPKFCVNCKYFLSGVNNQKYGKCLLFTKFDDSDSNSNYYLVTGDKDLAPSYYDYCCNARTEKEMCGNEAKFYKRKVNYKNNK